VSWRKSLRRRLGPVNVPHDEAAVTLHLEFDQISSPGNKIDYEIEATARGSSTHDIELALQQILSHARINWQPVALQHSPVPAITRTAAVTQ
jgi:hypothetical protein